MTPNTLCNAWPGNWDIFSSFLNYRRSSCRSRLLLETLLLRSFAYFFRYFTLFFIVHFIQVFLLHSIQQHHHPNGTCAPFAFVLVWINCWQDWRLRCVLSWLSFDVGISWGQLIVFIVPTDANFKCNLNVYIFLFFSYCQLVHKAISFKCIPMLF